MPLPSAPPACRDRPRPSDLVTLINDPNNSADQKPYWDNRQNLSPKRNLAIECCSYFYEFSAASANSGWYKGTVPLPTGTTIASMADFKNVQLRYGDQANIVNNNQQMPYSASRVPIVRCFHHFRDQKVICYQNNTDGTKSGTTKKDYITINVAYAGNVFVGPTWWEGTIYPGEATQTQP